MRGLMNSSGGLRLSKDARSRRHVLLMDVFRELHESEDGWMSSASQNDADVIVHITSRPREACTLYSFVDYGSWTSLSQTRVAGMNANRYAEIFYEDVTSFDAGTPDIIVVNGLAFIVSPALLPKMLRALDAIVAFVKSGELES